MERGKWIFLQVGWRKLEVPQIRCVWPPGCEAWWSSQMIRPRLHVGRMGDCGSHVDGLLLVLAWWPSKCRLRRTRQRSRLSQLWRLRGGAQHPVSTAASLNGIQGGQLWGRLESRVTRTSGSA